MADILQLQSYDLYVSFVTVIRIKTNTNIQILKNTDTKHTHILLEEVGVHAFHKVHSKHQLVSLRQREGDREREMIYVTYENMVFLTCSNERVVEGCYNLTTSPEDLKDYSGCISV